MADIWDQAAKHKAGDGDIWDQAASSSAPESYVPDPPKAPVPSELRTGPSYANRVATSVLPSALNWATSMLPGSGGDNPRPSGQPRTLSNPLIGKSVSVEGTKPPAPVDELGSYASGMGNMIKHPLESFADDPVGVGTAAVLGARGVAQAARSASQYAPSVASGLRTSAAKNYASILRNTDMTQIPAEQHAAESLVRERMVSPSRNSMISSVESKKQIYGPQAANAYANKPPVDPQPVIDNLRALQQKQAVVKNTGQIADQRLYDAADEMIQFIESNRSPNGSMDATALDDIADKFNRGHVSRTGKYSFDIKPQSVTEIERAVAKSAKGILNTAYPDALEINDRYRGMRETGDFLNKASAKERVADAAAVSGSNQASGAFIKRMIPRPLRTPALAATGFFDSVPYNTAMGAGKAGLANMLDPQTSLWPPPPPQQGQMRGLLGRPTIYAQGAPTPPAQPYQVPRNPGYHTPQYGTSGNPLQLPSARIQMPPTPDASGPMPNQPYPGSGYGLPTGSRTLPPPAQSPQTGFTANGQAGSIETVPVLNKQTGKIEYVPRYVADELERNQQ